jgi:hypothetical protein
MTTRREMLRLAPGLIVLLGASVSGCVVYEPAPSPAYSGYPPPPPAAEPPDMVWLPSPGVYVGMGFSYPLFFDGGSYYSNYGGRWYSGPSYRGPWQYRPGPPQSLHGFQQNAWGGYQDRARGYYQSNPNWKHFKPPR